MKVLNSKSGSFVSIQQIDIDIEEKQPCWYADMERGPKRKDYKWKVGRKYEGEVDEYSFSISKAGDINDEDFWQRATGIDFATELIDLFRAGGQKAIQEWIRNGCP